MTAHSEKSRIPFLSFLAAFALAVPALDAQFLPPALSSSASTPGGNHADRMEEEGDIVGAVEGDQYISPTRAFRITIPVLPELGGEINDTTNVVNFQDAFGRHASIGCFPINDNLRAEETKRGSRKDFLVWFFQNFVQGDFSHSFPGTNAESNARFINSVQGGTLFTQLLIPGGSVFAERAFIFPPNPPHVAKRGNFIFVNNDNIYVLSIELADRVFEHSTYNKTATEEEERLRQQLTELLGHITFTPPAAAPAPAPAVSPGASEVPSISFPGNAPASGASAK